MQVSEGGALRLRGVGQWGVREGVPRGPASVASAEEWSLSKRVLLDFWRYHHLPTLESQFQKNGWTVASEKKART